MPKKKPSSLNKTVKLMKFLARAGSPLLDRQTRINRFKKVYGQSEELSSEMVDPPLCSKKD